MIQPTDPFKGIVRISEAGFVQLLQSLATPSLLAERPAAQYYQAILATRDPQGLPVDPLLILAMFHHESACGTEGVARSTYSWGNTRLPAFGPSPVLENGVPKQIAGASGRFPLYRDWLDGLLATVARLVTPDWVYTGWGRTTIQEIWLWHDDPTTPQNEAEIVWAPAGDLNDPKGYLASVLQFMRDHTDMQDDVTQVPQYRKPCHIGLSPGHADTHGDEWGGEEVKRTIPLTQAIATELQRRGFNVTLQDPIPFSGDYHAVADWFAQQHQRDPFNLILQCHFEGNSSDTLGCFGIYPDNVDRDDHDLKAKAIGQAIAQALHTRIAKPYPLALRGDGTMSEASTGAGSLAWFSHTTNLKATAERLIVEFGAANSSAHDRAIADDPDFNGIAASCVADVLESFYGKQVPVTSRPPDTVSFDGTPYVYANGFKQLWLETQAAGHQLGYRLIGKPRSPEFEMEFPVTDGQTITRTVQVAERSTLIWNTEAMGHEDHWDLTNAFGEWDTLARAEAKRRGYL